MARSCECAARRPSRSERVRRAAREIPDPPWAAAVDAGRHVTCLWHHLCSSTTGGTHGNSRTRHDRRALAGRRSGDWRRGIRGDRSGALDALRASRAGARGSTRSAARPIHARLRRRHPPPAAHRRLTGRRAGGDATDGHAGLAGRTRDRPDPRAGARGLRRAPPGPHADGGSHRDGMGRARRRAPAARSWSAR